MTAQKQIALIGLGMILFIMCCHYSGLMTLNPNISPFMAINNTVGATLIVLLYTLRAYASIIFTALVTLSADVLYGLMDTGTFEAHTMILMEYISAVVPVAIVCAMALLLYRQDNQTSTQTEVT